MDYEAIEGLLESFKLRSVIFSRMELSGTWGFSKPPLESASFCLVTSGEIWVELPDGEPAVRVEVGDLIYLPNGRQHQIKGAPSAPVIPFKPLLIAMGWAAWTPGMRYKPGMLRYGSSRTPSTVMIAGVFGFEDRRENPMMSALPPLLHLRAGEMGSGGEA